MKTLAKRVHNANVIERYLGNTERKKMKNILSTKNPLYLDIVNPNTKQTTRSKHDVRASTVQMTSHYDL